MSKLKWNEQTIQRLTAEGRGKGIESAYKPWIEVSDFSSSGFSRRAFSLKTGRTHHLLSNVEWQLFLLLEFSPEVTDIREQYPLPRPDTQSIAAEIGVKHPTYPGTSVPLVMTTDFLVTFNRQGQKSLESYSCKRDDDAGNPRTLEKVELERRYFDSIGIPHRLVFFSTLPTQKIKNLEWIRSAGLPNEGQTEDQQFLAHHAERLVNELRKSVPSCSLASYCANYDARSGALPGTGLRVVRSLLWDKVLATDLNQPDLAASPVAMFHVTKQASPEIRLIQRG